MLIIPHFHGEEESMVEFFFAQVLDHFIYYKAQLKKYDFQTNQISTTIYQLAFINRCWRISIQYIIKLKLHRFQQIDIWFMDGEIACLVCLKETDGKERVQLKCGHIFCGQCIIKFIQTLRMYNQLRPDKLCCLSEGCHEEIEDGIITKLFPGELGFIFNIIKKRYRDSKDQNMVIFDCKGYLTADRKPLQPRPSSVSQQDNSLKLNELSRKIAKGEETIEGAKTCKNIFAHNKKIPRKQKNIVCLTCGCSYCVNCFALGHDGTCPIKDLKEEDVEKSKLIVDRLDKKGDDFQNFVTRNQILTCLNPKCQAVIAKEQGCFWVKCRCSYEMCYPCKKLWGDCQHFSKYPYSKFTPPPEWMVKALGLF